MKNFSPTSQTTLRTQTSLSETHANPKNILAQRRCEAAPEQKRKLSERGWGSRSLFARLISVSAPRRSSENSTNNKIDIPTNH